MSYKIGVRVEIIGKDCQGTIAYIGHLAFASGKWIGVILDEPKGKNNGSVKGQVYFKCAENHGMFVRQTQLNVLDDGENKSNVSTGSVSSPSTDDASAARARTRLSSSRLSLLGSKIQLSSSSSENLTTHHERKDAGESGIPLPSSIKRSSFVEKSPSTRSTSRKKLKAQDDRTNTGFVETLKPNFVPGQNIVGAMSASSNNSASSTSNQIEEKLTHLQLSQENDNLKAQVSDLNEKMETLRMKRIQDKEKMKEFEKIKLQMEQLLEFKSKVMESQASLQRELQRAKQDAREAQQAKASYQEEMADLSETVEMATLDKEMAEEKAETLQIELEQLKEKLEEKTLDFEILKNEVAERLGRSEGGGSGGSAPAANGSSNYELKQLEQQNIRLRETLVKMRDLTAHEKHEFQKLQKDLDQKKSEILELGRTKEKLSTRVEEMEHQIADLQEQVDAALGAAEMVELLGEKKMALEERVAEMEEAVADLEALQDMSDQLAESSKELELELREELDLALSSARDVQRHRDAALETLADRELTITKFRELTNQLQSQCLQLQNRLQSSEQVQNTSRGPEQQLAEILDFQKTFAETRAQTKAVDLELRRLDIEEACNHVKYLLSFMPPSFLSRGGDHDAIMVLLLIPRMIQKTEILISQVKDKYSAIENIDRSSLVRGHSIAQHVFRSNLCSHMHALQTFLGCFESNLNICTPEVLLKVGSTYPEMAAQEKALDALIHLAKRDQLDENVPMENIEKCCIYFATMLSIHFSDNLVANQARMVINGTRALGNICDAISTEATSIKALLEGDGDDIGALCQHIETTCEVIQQHLNSARRRVPREQSGGLNDSSVRINLGFEKDWPEKFIKCYQDANKISKTLQDLLKTTIQTIIADGDLDVGLSIKKLNEIILTLNDKHYDAEEGIQIKNVKANLIIVQQMAANLAQKMAECENDIAITGQISSQVSVTGSGSANESVDTISPIQLRANAVRKESEEIKELAKKIEIKDADIREVRLALRDKQEELSEMVLRKDLAEKRLATQQHEYDLNIEKLKRKVEEAQNQLKRKEKEFEEAMDHLQTDIDSLESERGQLKEKLKSLGKKITTPTGTPLTTDNSMSNISHINDTSIGLDNRLLMNEIASLKQALVYENRMKRSFISKDLQNKFNSLQSIPTVSTLKSNNSNIEKLEEKRLKILKDIQNMVISSKVPSVKHHNDQKTDPAIPVLEKLSTVNEFIKQRTSIKQLSERAELLLNEIYEMKMKNTSGGKITTNFVSFPSREMSLAFDEKNSLIAGRINVPFNGPTSEQQINVGIEDLRKVHLLMSY